MATLQSLKDFFFSDLNAPKTLVGLIILAVLGGGLVVRFHKRTQKTIIKQKTSGEAIAIQSGRDTKM